MTYVYTHHLNSNASYDVLNAIEHLIKLYGIKYQRSGNEYVLLNTDVLKISDYHSFTEYQLPNSTTLEYIKKQEYDEVCIKNNNEYKHCIRLGRSLIVEYDNQTKSLKIKV